MNKAALKEHNPQAYKAWMDGYAHDGGVVVFTQNGNRLVARLKRTDGKVVNLYWATVRMAPGRAWLRVKP